MVTQITQGIKISVNSNFEGTYYKNSKLYYAFQYEITIENHSKDVVQLMTRHWEILDSLQDAEVIDGEGVIGKKPVLKPNESHTYTSGCLLTSSFGAMQGYFSMVNYSTTHNFRVVVPAFKLCANFALN